MSEVTIRDQSIDTAGALAMLYAATDELVQRYGEIDDDGRLALDELRAPSGAFLVARLNAQLVGGVGLRRIGEASEHLGEVKRLWVRPDLRRQGIAAQLMEAIEDKARKLSFRQLYLETGPAQPEAISFYPKHQWQRVEQFPPGVFSHDVALRFTKVL